MCDIKYKSIKSYSKNTWWNLYFVTYLFKKYTNILKFFIQKIRSVESISNSNCESESLALVESKQNISETFDNYLQNSQPTVKSLPNSISPVSILLFIYYLM